MSDELHFTMEKKVTSRQSPCGNKSNVVTSEKKSDYVSNKNGRQKKFRESGNGGRFQDPLQPPRPSQKYNRGFGDKRPRQRGYSDYRQSEEVAEQYGMDMDIPTSRKGKGNANHLLNFSYQDRGYHGAYNGSRGAGSWGGRKAYRHYAPSYKKEQYLQASCQFIVQAEGDYSKQTIDPDALVDWDTVQLVRTFSTEMLTCPICLDVPIAAKITRCGHTYCWACILHYLQVNNTPKTHAMCPVCPEIIDADNLRSAQNVLVPDYKVGEDIEMKLMRKSKGSVFVCPEEEWGGGREGHLNMDAGGRTKFSKLLTATWSQVQAQVVEREKEALVRGLASAEQDEVCFLQMAQHLLQGQESQLKLKQKADPALDVAKPAEPAEEVKPEQQEVKELPSDVSFDGSKITAQYSDAFEETLAEQEVPSDAEGFGGDNCEETSAFAMKEMADALQAEENVTPEGVEQDGSRSKLEHEKESSRTVKMESLTPGTPIADMQDTLTPDEAADHLELPEISSKASAYQQRNRGTKDTYHFYQASTGQHIYMNSMNARCLDMEYGGLENSPTTIKATIVAIERIFMTEETRKRLRYLNHIPLTTEFHVVELKMKPPVVSKETLKHFQPEFDKRRKIRKQKAKEEKIQAKINEVEHKKLHGIYVSPEIHIPLDNTADFPSHLASSPEAIERRRKESTNSDIFPEERDGQGSPVCVSPRVGDTCGNSASSFASFAQKLQGAASLPAWPALSHSATMPEMRSSRSSMWGTRGDDEMAEDGGEEYHAPSMASSWLSSLHDLPRAPLSPPANDTKAMDTPGSGGKKKKKKKKEQQVLFATSMARKN